ncbi:hypothetical protein [Microbacterium hydrocarbonoxydans]|uniref:Peptidase inhibitor family I36 n=1 Tax=Microbacterium hydrocarbonoxydans TaxID=273678 RepID=A0A1H4IWD8_9MICO|nr:hypothetical protein [Microbacterium hydrocarbonoxydans]SEB37936.1 hypothetical protein SAMN04489807_0318 [Microbacterium hydrocarbonoxydans]
MPARFSFASAALITLLAVATPASALADTASEEPAACAVGGIAVPDGQPLPDDIPLVMSCFDSVEEAEQFIEDGAPGALDQLQPAEESARSARAAASTVIVGKAWTGVSRAGTVLIHYGSGSGCHASTYGFPTIASAWNNNVRSAEGLNNCWSTQYDGTSYTGAKITCTSYCATLGALAGKTSSIVYRPAGTWG